MAGEYLETDKDGLGRLAILIDNYYQRADGKLLGEIRLQEARFGLSPVDRSRLQWEIGKGEEAARRRVGLEEPTRSKPKGSADPRAVLRLVK